jgi:hypothetical protein
MTMNDPAAIAARNIYRRWEWTAAFTYSDMHQQAMILAWQRQSTWESERHAIRDLHYQLSNWVRKELRAQGWTADRAGRNWKRPPVTLSTDLAFLADRRGLGARQTGQRDSDLLRYAVDWPEMTRLQWDVFADYIFSRYPLVASEFEQIDNLAKPRSIRAGDFDAYKDRKRAGLRVRHALPLAEAKYWAQGYGTAEGIAA